MVLEKKTTESVPQNHNHKTEKPFHGDLDCLDNVYLPAVNNFPADAAGSTVISKEQTTYQDVNIKPTNYLPNEQCAPCNRPCEDHVNDKVIDLMVIEQHILSETLIHEKSHQSLLKSKIKT
eukprot:Tbor_TRINITY_DN5605_c3_g6::TRINITY_DN5605_c3_g6_i1::g.9125::m.9125